MRLELLEAIAIVMYEVDGYIGKQDRRDGRVAVVLDGHIALDKDEAAELDKLYERSTLA